MPISIEKLDFDLYLLGRENLINIQAINQLY